MSFTQNLIRARGHIVFLVALVAGLFLVQWLDSRESEHDDQSGTGSQSQMEQFAGITALPLVQPKPSSDADLQAARTAWIYFQNNTNAKTGLANSANDYPSTTMWETGSYLIAILSAERLGLIQKPEADSRLSAVLASLQKLRLFDGKLPNKAYNTETLELVDYTNKPSKDGLGWSALDVARIMSSFALINRNHPELAPQVEALLKTWQIDQMIENGQLIGTNIADGKIRRDQEGRLGYEQYAAKAMMLFGYDASRAFGIDGKLMVKEVEGLPIAVDARPQHGGAPGFVVSEPYLFDGLEFGFDARSQLFATTVYQAQAARFASSGHLTAVTEGHLNEKPYFSYATVWGGGTPWAVLSFKGERMDSRRTLSTKAAFGWDALFGTDYTAKLVAAVAKNADPAKGWAEGIYEEGGAINTSVTANTNAVILAALSFKATGPLIRPLK
jgi:hypothetical protein